MVVNHLPSPCSNLCLVNPRPPTRRNSVSKIAFVVATHLRQKAVVPGIAHRVVLSHPEKLAPSSNVNANHMLSGQAIYHAINGVRLEHHEKALSPDVCLVREANRRAKEVALKFAHAHKPFCGRSLSGENLSKGYKTTESVKSAWLKSPTHRENLLWKDYKRTGIGIYEKDGVTYVVQLFSN